jgi:hypothetical protein
MAASRLMTQKPQKIQGENTASRGNALHFLWLNSFNARTYIFAMDTSILAA